MKISYSILTHNETQSLADLIDFLVIYKDDDDEIVILDDYSDNEETKKILDAIVPIYNIVFEQRHLHKDYAGQKNHLTSMCNGEYIVNIDADEIPHKWLMTNLKNMIEANPTIDLFWIPRINTVTGLTQEHINKWKWQVNQTGWVNFPDYQGRVWKNRQNIRWKNEVHEVLEGYQEHTYLPQEEEFCFYHHKEIDKQEQQNKFYEGIKN